MWKYYFHNKTLSKGDHDNNQKNDPIDNQNRWSCSRDSLFGSGWMYDPVC
jgi:hypothetical protein